MPPSSHNIHPGSVMCVIWPTATADLVGPDSSVSEILPKGICNFGWRGSGELEAYRAESVILIRETRLLLYSVWNMESGSNEVYGEQFLGTWVQEYARDILDGQGQPRICTGSLSFVGNSALENSDARMQLIHLTV